VNYVDVGTVIIVEARKLKRLSGKTGTVFTVGLKSENATGGSAKRAATNYELKARNRELEAKLLMARPGKRQTMSTKQKFTKCMVVGDSVLHNVGAEHADMKVECFTGIKTEQLYRVIEKRDLGRPETVIIHVGTNDMRTTRNLRFVMGEVYALVSTAKKKLPNCRLVLSGV
jgi:hypothetical protein